MSGLRLAVALRGVLLGTVLLGVQSPGHAQVPSNPFSYSRGSSFGYDATSGLLNAETVEPGNIASCVLTTYLHDAYGNKTSATTANCAGSVPARQQFASRTSATTFAAQAVAVAGFTPPAGMFPTLVTNALGQSGARTYDGRFGTMASLQGPNLLTTSWTVDAFGRKTKELRADGTSTVTAYCYLTSASAANSTITSTASNNSTSNNPPDPISCPTPPAGEAPADAVFLVHSEPHDKTGAKMGPYTRVYSDRLGRQLRTVTQGFDATTQPGTAGGAAAAIYTDTRYDANSVARVKTQPYFAANTSSTTVGSADYGAVRTDVDALGRPTAIYTADPNGSRAGIQFGLNGGAFDGTHTLTASIVSKAYNGLSATATNDKNHSRTEEKNVSGEVVRITDEAGAQLARQFDAFGYLIHTVDAMNNSVTQSYDIRGRKVSMTDPDAGTTTYDYDALGELVWQQTAKQLAAGTSTTFGYDVLGRMTSRVEPEDTSNWYYDKTAAGVYCEGGAAIAGGTTTTWGKLCEARTNTNFDRIFVYDGLGRPLSNRTTVTSGPSFASAVTYEAATGRMHSQSYPTGLTVNYNYTPTLGYLASLTLATSAQVTPFAATPGGPGPAVAVPSTLWQANAVDAWGKAESSQTGNGVLTLATFEGATGRTKALTAGTGGQFNVQNDSYTWDSLNNLASRYDSIGDGTTGAVSENFVYDVLNRLTQYQAQATSILPPSDARTVTLSYNAIGNLLYKSDVGVYSYPAAGAGSVRPHSLATLAGASAVSYSYDANGNLITATGGKYTGISYTSFNMPDGSAGVSGAAGRYQWQYDTEHQRIEEVRTNASSTRTTWMLHPDNAGGLGFESETTVAGSTTTVDNRHFLSAGGVAIGILVSQGAVPPLAAGVYAPPTITSITLVKVEFWHRDSLGSLVATTDHTAAVTARYSYDPFGKRRYTGGSYDSSGAIVVDWTTNTNNGTQRGFTGHEQLDDVGLVHMNGRLFDPNTGRFIQPDPMVQNPDNLQNYNRYGYCYNNPLNCTDPTGQFFGIDDLLVYAIIATVFADVTGLIDSRTARMLLSIEVGAALPGSSGLLAGVVDNPVAQAAIAGFVSGAISGGGLKGGIRGAIFAAANYGIGAEFGHTVSWNDPANFAGSVLSHAVLGCVQSVTAGGKCGPGALSGAFSKLASPLLKGLDKPEGVLLSAIIGGTASALGGGKFANGAETGAFSYLFNDRGEEKDSKRASCMAPTIECAQTLDVNNKTLQIGGGWQGGVIVPWFGFSYSFTVGLSFDSSQFSFFAQGQLAAGIGGGAWVSSGPAMTFGYALRPETSLTVNNYLEWDVMGLSGSRLGDDRAMAEPLDGFPMPRRFMIDAVGAGAFQGKAVTGTLNVPLVPQGMRDFQINLGNTMN
jgi:RHS repeat-associated protein